MKSAGLVAWAAVFASGLFGLAASQAHGREIKAASVEQIRAALASAQPGDTILIKPGEYNMGGEFATGKSGTRDKPIILSADGPKGYAKLRASSQIAFRIRSKFWAIRGIHVEGDSGRTAAVVFMDGPAGCSDIHITDCKISGSSEHGMKAARNREQGADRILVEHTELFDTRATGFDLVSGDNWTVRRNYVHDFGKGGGVTYGIFLKGGGKNGIIEGNVVDGGGRNTTIGISFGGGLTGKQWLPLGADGKPGPEHDGGIARNNIVVNVSDVAFHSNNAANCKFYNNLAFKCSGFQRQGSQGPDPLLANNLIGTSLRGVDPRSTKNLSPDKAWFVNPDKGDFRLTAAGKNALAGKGVALSDNPADLFARPRPRGPLDLGPINAADINQPAAWIDRRK